MAKPALSSHITMLYNNMKLGTCCHLIPANTSVSSSPVYIPLLAKNIVILALKIKFTLFYCMTSVVMFEQSRMAVGRCPAASVQHILHCRYTMLEQHKIRYMQPPPSPPPPPNKYLSLLFPDFINMSMCPQNIVIFCLENQIHTYFISTLFVLIKSNGRYTCIYPSANVQQSLGCLYTM